MTAGPPHAPHVLDVAELAVSYRQGARIRRVVQDVSFAVRPGEVTALLGESGSGKTTIARAIAGLLPANARREAGRIRLGPDDITSWPQRRLNTVRGVLIGFVPQDPSNSLNPVQTIGTQVGEMFRLHDRLAPGAIRERVTALLDRVGLTDPALRFGQYPHELSGGMRQRVLIASAIALNPALVIADEPTSALDVTVQRQILDLLDGLRREYGTAILLVTHDLGVTADRADQVIVLNKGRICERGPALPLFAAPREDYTKRLLADRPVFAAAARAAPPADTPAAITVSNLTHAYSRHGGDRMIPRAVDAVSFQVRRGTTHAIVGESGSGKTTILRCLMGLITPTSGSILVEGTEVTALTARTRRAHRRQVQLVYQNPHGSLDPKHDVLHVLDEPLRNFTPLGRAARRQRILDMLDRVRLPRDILERRTGMMSGGQCQRVALARALLAQPRILVLDEVVSALDVSVQAQILRLLTELQAELGLTYVFVSHDLAVVRQISDSMSVLRHGVQVEEGAAEPIFTAPATEYTRALIAAVPGRKAESVHA
ncbi:ABC transporter ATP-binding protein [Nguyenibacter sp. L1]|uniref:ABC transporter ATP-binding protein n=1 Tax=Nguyenibacter sp. L1 TaxID=3049350 RepID=UPI002B47DD09|nr:ABC transporter ATP-binding protein [Nguyenibacter sp. L1]WRH88961.1 ABC transporter ATP-binding protein [Nguyenibacter sp. L1]